MEKIRFVTQLFKELLFRPSQYFLRITRNQVPFKFPVLVYAVSSIMGGVFYCLKPQGFPQDSFSSDMGAHSFGFWLCVGAMGFVLTLLTAALAWVFFLFLDKRSPITLKNVVLIIFSSHIYYVLLFLFLAIATAARAENFYKISEIILSLISFIFALSAIRAVSEISVGKVFLGLFTSSMAAAAILYGMYLAGVLPAEILKALLFS